MENLMQISKRMIIDLIIGGIKIPVGGFSKN